MTQAHLSAHGAAAGRAGGRPLAAAWRPGLVIAASFMGSTILTPLYPAYQQAFHLSVFVVTLIYGAYVIGNLSALLLFGRLSDRLGRRPVALAALAITAASAAVFLVAQGPWTLGAGRALSGLGVGLGAGAGAAWTAELFKGGDRKAAATLTTIDNFLGLAVGAGLAGLLAQFAPAPLRLVFWVYLVLLALVAVGVLTGAETVAKPGGLRRKDLTPRLGVPTDLRAMFVTPAIAVFVTMATVGFYAALVPGVVAKILRHQSPAAAAGVVAEFCACTALAIALTRKAAPRTAMLWGLALSIPGLGLVAATELWRSFPLQAAAAAVGGAAAALTYRGSLEMINAESPGDRRAEVISAYYAMGFVGNSLPIIGVGAITASLGAATASEVFAGVLAALSLAALAWRLAVRPKTQP